MGHVGHKSKIAPCELPHEQLRALPLLIAHLLSHS